MQTDQLKRVIERVEQLPADQQNAIALTLERELEEREWDALVAQPRSRRFLDELAAEARREEDTHDVGDHW